MAASASHIIILFCASVALWLSSSLIQFGLMLASYVSCVHFFLQIFSRCSLVTTFLVELCLKLLRINFQRVQFGIREVLKSICENS